MKKWTKILLIIVIVILLLFVGMSYFIGRQVFMGSTQLVTCEDTSKVKDSFWERYNMDYDVFCSTYTIEKVEITSTFDEHMIPADYIYALGEEGDKNNPTVELNKVYNSLSPAKQKEMIAGARAAKNEISKSFLASIAQK